jgi:hypothetical protein
MKGRTMNSPLQTLTLIHVALSLLAIASGFIVMIGLLYGKRLNGWTAVFLITTVATSVTGFFFPFQNFTPAIAVGIVSLIVLAAAIAARYAFSLAGHWRLVYVVGAVIALYLNVFVLVVQSFQKIPALNAIAPTQSEPPFLLTQLAVLTLFIALGIVSTIRFQIGQPKLHA